MTRFSYPEVGASQHRPLPVGYRHLSYRVRLDGGFEPAAEAILSWRLHRLIGLRVDVAAPRVAAGVRITTLVGFGPLTVSAPCEVVWTVQTGDRAGFGYGTLPGHPFIGEESFVVSRTPDGVVWFEVSSFSRPASWYMKVVGPVAVLLQRAYARRCGRVMRGLSRPH